MYLKFSCYVGESIIKQIKLTDCECWPQNVSFYECVYFMQISPVFAGPVTNTQNCTVQHQAQAQLALNVSFIYLLKQLHRKVTYIIYSKITNAYVATYKEYNFTAIFTITLTVTRDSSDNIYICTITIIHYIATCTQLATQLLRLLLYVYLLNNVFY